MADICNIKRLKFIRVDEDRGFHTIVDVMNSCFGKSWNGYQKGFIPLNDGSGHVVWFPGMAKKRGDKFVPFNTARGWLNMLRDDGKVLVEENADVSRLSISDDEKLPRYVFGHYEDGPYRNGRVQIGEKGGYRFLGIFQIDLEHSTDGHREYIQVSDRADLYRYTDEDEFDLPETDVIKANETVDDELIRKIRRDSMFGQTIVFEYMGVPRKAKEPLDKDGVRIFPRDMQTAVNALAHAEFACEIDPQHPTFIRKHSDKTYTEPHHLVPLAMQDQFDVSLDVEENIISLCSNCHNEIHYGEDADRLIRELYAKRKDYLATAGIVVSEKNLLFMYGYADDSQKGL